MDKLSYSNLGKGSLLLASPEQDSGNYMRSVLLLCEHSPAGSFGVRVNLPYVEEFPDDLSALKELQESKNKLRVGGPIQPQQMMLLHSSDRATDEMLPICDGVWLGGDFPFLQEIIVDPAHPPFSLFFGYTGWGPGELEREFMNGHWFLVPATKEALFEIEPDKLWKALLKNMGGKYAKYSLIPDDPSLN